MDQGMQESKELIEKRNAEYKAAEKLRKTAWQDLTSDQKTERTREQLKDMMRSVNYRLNDISPVVDKLKEHSHLGENVVTPLKTRDYRGSETCGIGYKFPEGKEYF